MKFTSHKQAAPGWIGGFEQSNPAFPYPNPKANDPLPDLSSLLMEQNMTHINLLTRQQNVQWPEFSWETVPGIPDSRCYQMFSPYISRLGYTDTGKVYSIICPQQGLWIKGFGTLNVEVTVTGNRGWVDEDTREIYADMTVEPKIWFSPDIEQSPLGKTAWTIFESLSAQWPFPSNKQQAIQLNTYNPQVPGQKIFPLLRWTTTDFPVPTFAQHYDEAWSVANLEVKIGEPQPTTSTFVDDFNRLVMNVFNAGSGNMLLADNVLAWNVWFNAPELVDTEEWAEHAEKWRTSIDVKHTAPTGSGSTPKFFSGKEFTVEDSLIEAAVMDLMHFLLKHAFDKHSQMVH
ncbi:hypothetical protein FUA23_05550 [Neolewinella aurantiaca]|uniref:Uncharacterized protein n=1 Tax=Neolewinella aurantiaca TaxID=2602767 RepID=A0A5C7FKT7_9BACT|nr:hypothetical protein [Neolewinella aurantiaca]TXF90563.1 hypothetical protein FUA23_05550 [Neolewinella aurantiaca]